jgi:site-specific DNA recombinase
MTAALSRPIRAAFYGRKSNEDDGDSIEQQRQWAGATAARDGAELLQEFADQSVSGWDTARRDEFRRMLVYCQEQHQRGRPVEAIYCWHTNRFSRSDSLDTAHFLHEFRKAGVTRIRTHERWYDLNKKEDRALFHLEQDFSNNPYSINRAADTSRGQVRNARQRYFNGGTVPFAFDRMLLNDRDEPVRRLLRGEKTDKPQGWHTVLIPVENPAEIEMARWIFQTFADRDISARALANELNARGVPGPGSAEKGRVTRWCRQSVLSLLQNAHYVGDAEYGRVGRGKFYRVVGGESRPVSDVGVTKSGRPKKQVNTEGVIVNPEAHQGIIDRDLWERVQKKLAARRQDRRFPRRGGYPLAGLVLCGHCGKRMHGATGRYQRRKNRRTYRRYVCASHNLSGASACGYHAVREDLLMPFLVRKLQADYLAPSKIDRLRDRLLKRLTARRGGGAGADQSKWLQARLADVDAQIKTATLNVLRARDNLDLLNEALTELRTERDRLEAELRKAEARKSDEEDVAATVEEAIEKLRTLAKWIADADPARLREMLRQMLVKVELYFEAVPKRKNVYHRLARGVATLRSQLGEGRFGECQACDRNTSSTRLMPRCQRNGAMYRCVTSGPVIAPAS